MVNSSMGLDAIDESILVALQADGRISWTDLADQVGLSAPAVRDRVKSMERDGVITGYSVQVAPEKIGLPIRAIIRLNEPYQAGNSRKVDTLLTDMPEILECHRVTGTESHVARALVHDTSHLEQFLEQLWPYASTITNIVTSTPVARRHPPIDTKRWPPLGSGAR